MSVAFVFGLRTEPWPLPCIVAVTGALFCQRYWRKQSRSFRSGSHLTVKLRLC